MHAQHKPRIITCERNKTMTATPPTLQLGLPLEQIVELCRRWSIVKLEVFGSALREDFRPESDVDFLATFEADATWSLMDRVGMKNEMEELLGRKVDFLNRAAIEQSHNSTRRRAILESAQTIYARE
jgi:uncharacterized protein